MKKVLLSFIGIIACISLFAQSPNQFKYQAVLRNADGTIMAEENVTIVISVLKSDLATKVFEETHSTTTSNLGLIVLNIGSVEDLGVIDWTLDEYYIETSVNGMVMGTSQLLSVPYALNAKTAENITGGITETDPVYSSWAKDYSDLSNKPNIIDSVSAVIDTTSQFVRLEIDGDSANELQDLTYTNNLLTIENGNSVTINESPWLLNGSNIHFNNGLVGIGVSSPAASIDIYDNLGYPFIKFVSEDNVYTSWISNRTGVDDYLVGLDGGNNRFMIGNITTGYFPVIIHGGNTGIGTYSPEAPLHITDFMKLEPRATSPSSPSKGMIYYDSTDDKLKVFTGSIWEDLN